MIIATALRDSHAALAWVVVIGNGLAGLWSLAAHRVERLRLPALWVFTAIVQLAIALQVTLGAALVASQDIEVDQFHMFYGFIALVGAGIIYSYRQQLAEHRYLLYGGGGIFLMGLSIRAMTLPPLAG